MRMEAVHAKNHGRVHDGSGKIGKRMTVPKDKLIEWIDKQMTA